MGRYNQEVPFCFPIALQRKFAAGRLILFNNSILAHDFLRSLFFKIPLSIVSPYFYRPKRFLKSAVKIPPHPALSPGIGGEGKGEGEIRSEDGIHRRAIPTGKFPSVSGIGRA
jgi:hypothetical protein